MYKIKKYKTVIFKLLTFLMCSVTFSILLTILVQKITSDYRLLTIPWSFGPFITAIIFKKYYHIKNSFPFFNPKISLLFYLLVGLIPIIYVFISLLFASAISKQEIIIFDKAHVILDQNLFITLVITMLAVWLEEYAWRGFLTKYLNQLGVKKTSIIIGLIWSIWHYPVIFTGDYQIAKPFIIGLTCFTVSIIGLSTIYNVIVYRYNSWTPIWILHIVHNLANHIYSSNAFNNNESTMLLTSESGVINAFIISILAIIMIYFKLKKEPNEY